MLTILLGSKGQPTALGLGLGLRRQLMSLGIAELLSDPGTMSSAESEAILTALSSRRSGGDAGWTADDVAETVKGLGYLAVTVISESEVYSSIGTKSIKVRVGTGMACPSASPVSDCVFTGTMDVWVIVV